MTSKIVKIGKRVLAMERHPVSVEDGSVYQMLVGAELQNSVVPDSVRYTEHFLFVEACASRLNFPVSSSLVYMVYYMADNEPSVVLLLFAAIKALASKNLQTQQGVSSFFEAYEGECPCYDELFKMSQRPSVLSVLQNPANWSI